MVDEILVRPGIHLVDLASGSGEDLAVTGDLDIRSELVIRGAASDFSIIQGSAAGAIDRLFQIHEQADDVVILRVALRGGTAADLSQRGGVLWNQETGPNSVDLVEVEISGGTAGSGGGIFNEGNLNIQRSRIVGNQTTIVPGTTGNHGGGVASSGPSAQLRIEDSEIVGNQAEESGAGLWVESGPLALYRSDVTDNIAGGSGGGLYVAGSGYDVEYVEFARNRANEGGGVYMAEQGEVQRSAFLANRATLTGGGLHDAFGGFARFSTFAQNIAPIGAGVFANSAQTLLDSDTIAQNNGGGVHNQSGVFFENTLLAQNAGGNCTGNAPAFGAFNLDTLSSCGFVSSAGAPNFPNTNPMIGPLQDNGGPTPTLALLSGSPAIDQVTSEIRTNCQNMLDQRGYPRGRPRTQNGVGDDVYLCDIGAFERTPPFVVNSLADAVDANLADDLCATGGGSCTLRAAIQQANAIPGMNEITLGAGVHTLAIGGGNEDAAATGDLDIDPPLSIRGAGAALTTIHGGGLDRVFDVGSPLHLLTNAPDWTLFEDLGVTGGNANPDNGGAIAARNHVRVSRVVLSGNEGGRGGAISTSETGVFFLPRPTRVEISDSTIENNPGGGALFIADARIEGSSLVNQSNTSIGGAGEFNSVRLTNSTVSGNLAASSGAFFANQAIVDSTTIVDNAATGDTGGVFVLELSVFRNSILADNRVAGALQNCSFNFGGITSFGFNLTDGDAAECLFDVSSDQSNIAPLVGTLADNGGPTRTHTLLAGSPAIDRGGACPIRDQRRLPRPLDGDGNGSVICDVGSVEVPEPTLWAGLLAGAAALWIGHARRHRSTTP